MYGLSQPILILSEGSTRQTGKDAQKANIAAAVSIAEAVRSTLGPKGMDKMLVDSVGDITITNDGVTILNEMEIQHPAAKMMVEVAKTQEQEVGDGTTTAVVLAGYLLKNAEALLDQGIHRTTIVEGYRLASQKAIELLKELSEKVSLKDEDKLKKVRENYLALVKENQNFYRIDGTQTIKEVHEATVEFIRRYLKQNKKDLQKFL